MSFMRMFKSTKKNNNKENVPSMDRENRDRTIDRDSFRNSSMMESFNGGVYAGEVKNAHIINPYSVVTAPKKNKGPRSCPGAPMDSRSERSSRSSRPFNDRHLNNSVRYENLRVHRRNDYGQRNYMSDIANRSIKEEPQRDQYYESFPESDEEEHDLRIRMLETKLGKMQRRYHEDVKHLKRELEISRDEIEHYKRNFERQSRAYLNAKKSLDLEKQQMIRLKKALQQANTRVIELEDLLASGNENSLLMCSYDSGGVCNGTTGAGEALCAMGEHIGDLNDMVNSSTPSISMFQEGTNDLDAQDEMRIFRTVEVEDGDDDYETPPIEKPRDACSPVELNIFPLKTPKLTKSLSDTDLTAVTITEEPRTNLNNSVMPKRTFQKDLYAKAQAQFQSELTSESSDEEAYKVIERQLKKKGGLVKFQPPRPQVQARHYKKYGKNERNALAEFEYLQDLSSDVSGMLSSPDVGGLQAQMKC
ncbi:unnamed protein product [Auanema sp. JU1783]|nr:unnamed protein product [Auanema sp. JU1783]